MGSNRPAPWCADGTQRGQAGGHRQQGASRLTRRRGAAHAGPRAGRGPVVRGGRRRRDPPGPCLAGIARRRADPPGHGHRQRDDQLHPDPDGRAGRRLRQCAGRGAVPRAWPSGIRPPTWRASTPRPRPPSWPASPSGTTWSAGDVDPGGHHADLRRPTSTSPGALGYVDQVARRRGAVGRGRAVGTGPPGHGSQRPSPGRCARRFNAVFIEGEAVGELMFYGRGAGGMPTASAVLGDLIDAAHNLLGRHHRPGPRPPAGPSRARWTSLSPGTTSPRRGRPARCPGRGGRRCSAPTACPSARWSRRAARRGPARLHHPPGPGARHPGHTGRAAGLDVVARIGGVLRVVGDVMTASSDRRKPLGWRGLIEEYREFLPVSRRPRRW